MGRKSGRHHLRVAVAKCLGVVKGGRVKMGRTHHWIVSVLGISTRWKEKRVDIQWWDGHVVKISVRVLGS